MAGFCWPYCVYSSNKNFFFHLLQPKVIKLLMNIYDDIRNHTYSVVLKNVTLLIVLEDC